MTRVRIRTAAMVPYVQSERQKAGIYMEYAKKLVEKGEAYYCFCTQERLNSLKKTVNGEEIMVYDKHCLHLTKEEVEANLKAGKPFVIRQNNPKEGTTTFHDEIYGDITVDNCRTRRYGPHQIRRIPDLQLRKRCG